MANIQKTLDSLQPYVIGIRYVEGTPIVDSVFKEGWTIIDEPNIKKIKGNEEMNYYMIFSDIAGIGLDELLAYVEKVINVNQEKEKKHQLLRTKVNELKDIFVKTSLAKLTTLKFTFGEEDLMPTLDEFNLGPIEEPSFIEEIISEPQPVQPVQITQPVQYLDENKNPIELTEEDKELLEEEARGLRNIQMTTKKKPISVATRNIELPPKVRPQKVLSEQNFSSDCECGPNEACDKCIDSKGY